MGAIDDATGLGPAATFRAEEDTAGYFEVLHRTIREHGLPAAIYRDRHGSFEHADARLPTQLGRAVADLGIGSIAARSPQATGRSERLWSTFQDRLVAEPRWAGAAPRPGDR